MKLTYLGHSCLQIDLSTSSGGIRLVIDPGVFSPELPEEADVVLLTHAHADHVAPASVAALMAGGARLITDASALAVLEAADVLEDDAEIAVATPGAAWAIDDIEVEAIGGLHAVIHADLKRETNIGFLIRSQGVTLFHPGDSYEYAPPGVDVLAVPVSSPWAAAKDAVDFVRAVRPAQAVPIHDNLLVPGARAMFLGLIGSLGGAPLHDIANDGPLEV